MGTPVSSGNQGVMALGASPVNLCARDGREVVLFLGHRDNKPVPFCIGGETRLVPLVNCRLSPRARLRDHLGWILLASLIYRAFPLASLRRTLSRVTPWIHALEKVDLVGDVRGGDSFSDIYGMRRFLDGFFMALTVLMVKGSLVLFPQTFGPYKHPMARILARYLLRHSSLVMARDEVSRRVAEELIGSGSNVLLCPDVAFSLEALRPEKIQVDPPLEGAMPSGLIGLNVNGLMYNGGYTRENMFGLKLDYRSVLPGLVEVLLKVHDGELWLVPHTYGPPESVESDPEACRKIRQMLPEGLKERVRIVTGEYDCHELKWIVGQCDFFVGSRMHSCIAALSQGIPCVGIAYSRKFQGVFETVGMGEWVVDGCETTDQQTIARVMELYQRRNEVRQELKRNAEEARKRLFEVFERLFRETVSSR